MKPLLEVDNLRVEYVVDGGSVTAVDDVTFALERGESFGLVGESGCGKTTVARTVLGILPKNARVTGGTIRLEGLDILSSRETLRRLRWRHLSLVPQSAMNGLNPVYRVGSQIREALTAHGRRDELDDRVEHLLGLAGLDPMHAAAYPHQLSGGMRQRAMIAMALALDPPLVLLDEPTTALDVILQYRIVRRLVELKRELGLSFLLISHDLGLVSELCDRLGVMYAGRLVEVGPIDALLTEPAHPYTMGLRAAIPTLAPMETLVSIPGTPPVLDRLIKGCAFVDRCPFAERRCSEERQALHPAGVEAASACHFSHRADEFRVAAAREETWRAIAEPPLH